jgi:membrane-bound serine protease (ClpP class)
MDMLRRSCHWHGRCFARGLVWLAALFAAGTSLANNGTVVMLDVDGPIGVATADYLSSGFQHARDVDAELIILRMDTPGGLVSSTRDIIQDILASPIPVVTWVAPEGARADSAGTYILLASHVAAMAPTTHLGAATPVSLTGDDATSPDFGKPPSPDATDDSEPRQAPDRDADDALQGGAMGHKILNDAVAYIRALAERHGRNADWAERAVREAATLTASQALDENVIEIIAEDQEDLLQQLNGREVVAAGDTVSLATEGADVEDFAANWRIKLLAVISNPEIVLILGMIGLYGLMYEGWNPGGVLPGVVGVICLLLAAYALQVLPVNYAGLALLLVGVALMVAEAFAPSFGALGLGGIAAFVFGAIIMFDSGVPGYDISVGFVLAIALVAASAIIWMISYVLRLRRRGAVSGRASIVGGTGTAMQDFDGAGRVWLEGEAWAARSTGPVRRGQPVLVRDLDGLTLDVEPLPASEPTDPAADTGVTR